MAEPPDVQALQAQAFARQREIESAFAVVFGAEGRRNAEQALVWENLLGAGFESRPIIMRFDPIEIAANAANHDLVVKIKDLVKKGSTPNNPGNFPGVGSVRE